MPGPVCPVWLGYWLASPLRRIVHKPEWILYGLVNPGMTVLELGPGMGFFTLPLARMVGREGKVIAAEVQEGMLKALRRRAGKAGLGARIIPHPCPKDSLALEEFQGKVDFALAFAVLHEMPDVVGCFRELAGALKPEALTLVAEPRGHTSSQQFEKMLAAAERARLFQIEWPKIFGCHVVLLEKDPGVKES